MNRIAILTVEDEPEVRQAIERDLESFATAFRVETAADVADAREVIATLAAQSDTLGLIISDHRLPGTSGVDFLTELEADPAHPGLRKILLTGQADQADTIRAINSGGLDRYIAKPWSADELRTIVTTQLTEFILERDIDPMPYLGVLADPRLLTRIGRGPHID
ncbi:MAG: hypothetical protein RLZ97_591 [Verrucomicrobiota bacterium]